MKDSSNYSFGPSCPVVDISTSPTLLNALRDGDELSRERLITLYWPLVYHRYLAKVPEEDRRDLAQRVFATVFEKIGVFVKRFDGPAFRGWLYRIAYHKVGDYIRQKRRDARLIDASPTDQVSRSNGQSAPSHVSAEWELLVHQALEIVRQEFEPTTYQAAWAQLVEGRTANQVAAEMGKSVNAMYISKSRVLRRVREILTGLGELGESSGHGSA